MNDIFYITTPIYYVNDEPHIGHAYTTIFADTIAKYHRLLGEKAFMLTGTDEHGQKVQQAAGILQIDPQTHCDRMCVKFKDLWVKMEIGSDDFIRTTEERHKKVVREVLNYIDAKGEIYQDEFEGWYCVHDERYFLDKDLQEGNCPECGRPVNLMKEKNYFFKMSKYQDWLIEYIKANPDFIQPEFRKNEVLGFLRQPLKDLCISRPKFRLNWGIPLPFDEEYVTYVWFDALLNYYSAVKSKGIWPATVHLIGKDILTTHSVYWPIMLKAADIELPKTIFAHGWWLAGDKKMSKSVGNVVKPLQMADKYGVEAFRYFLMREMTPGLDASFSEAGLIQRLNSDLANDLGNLLSRVTTLIEKFFDGVIPEKGQNDCEWVSLAEECEANIRQYTGKLRVDEVVKTAMLPVNKANRYLEETAPWKLAKKDKIAAGAVLYNALEAVRWTSLWLTPVMPGKCGEILNRIGAVNSGINWGGLKSGQKMFKGEAVFPRIEIKLEEKKEEPVVFEDNLISIDDFRKVELMVAEILTAEKVPGADKLLKLRINLGSEERQLVAGIALLYSPEQLIGKKIIVVANLRKAKIRGIESQGMLLAASKDGKMRLLTVDGEMEAGGKIS